MVICIARGENEMTSNQSRVVEQQTEEILEYLVKIVERFEEVQSSGDEPDFFQTVKPFADNVYHLLLRWEKDTKEWIQAENPKYIHVQQIDSTVENINLVSVQCFYPDTREKRFKGMIQSIRYVLNDIISKKQ
jgi:hypothetical protein